MRMLVLPGDGIGPEIMAQNSRVLQTLNKKYRLGIIFDERTIGLTALKQKDSTFPEEVLNAAKNADATILGPVSTFQYPSKEEGGVSTSATLRIELDIYANIRPNRTRGNVPSVIKQMDMVIVRENTEGFYADRNMFLGSGEFMPTKDIALSVRKITFNGSQRIAKKAFEISIRRRKKVTIVHKANVLKMTDGLFLAAAREVAEGYPDVEVEDLIVDAAAAHIIRRSQDFDVLLTTNMYGDILSDEAAELSGGLGLGGSINVGDSRGIAQAAHGSAPDIEGKGIANPTALMMSTASLLDWLGERHQRLDFRLAAEQFNRAVDEVLSDPVNHTPDLGGRNSTIQFGNEVIAKIDQ